ncbi:MAG: plastocyanin/azurin family copper-binding protein, partial [Thermoanaerobaculia bacterium]|nr:plastocyanin/azurin family copper-binding protein [Thermoanaerobaculia bacterium]
ALAFEPATVRIERGQTVLWTNPSEVKHTVTANPAIVIEPESVTLPSGAAPFDSGPIAPGEFFAYTFTVVGTYDYVCIPHELEGMVGTVVVAESSAAAAAETDLGATAQRGEPTGESVVSDRGGRRSRFVFGGHQPPRHPEVRRAEGFLAWIYWFGNFHPPLVSLPIGLLLGAALAELLYWKTRRSLFLSAARFCVAAGALGALAAGGLGWLLAGFRIADGAWLLTTHRWLGTTAVVLSLVLFGTSERAYRSGDRRFLRALLFATALVVLTTGFFGGSMIYGIDQYALP